MASATLKLQKLRQLAVQKQARDAHGRFASTNSRLDDQPSAQGRLNHPIQNTKSKTYPHLAVKIKHPREAELNELLTHSAIMERGQRLTAQLDKALAKASTEGKKRIAMRKFQASLIESSPLSEADAKTLATGIEMHETVPSAFRSALVQDATDFHRMTGGMGVKSLGRFEVSRDRAFASIEMRSVNISPKPKTGTIFHEMGHHLEHDERVAKAARDFRDRRATGPIQPLRDLYDDPEKRKKIPAGEVVVPDSFVSPYVGRVYPLHGRTEVVSVGLSHFATAGDMLSLYEQDKEHFQFIVGLIRPYE